MYRMIRPKQKSARLSSTQWCSTQCFDRLDLIRFCLEQLEWIKNLLWLRLTQACFFRPTQLKLSLFWLTRLKQRWVRQRALFGTTRLKMMIIWLNWLNEKVFDRVGLKRTLFWPIRHEMVMFWQNRLKQKLFVCVWPKILSDSNLTD